MRARDVWPSAWARLRARDVWEVALPPDRGENLVVITGFNSDVKYRGLVYHVQTEDKGQVNPLIETLIYRGGEILAWHLSLTVSRLITATTTRT